jgi:hypothetical protein
MGKDKVVHFHVTEVFDMFFRHDFCGRVNVRRQPFNAGGDKQCFPVDEQVIVYFLIRKNNG